MQVPARQGQLHSLVDEDTAALWSDVVQKLPPECLKFMLNAAHDTLSHNSNLSVWRREAGLSAQCKLCGQQQTLLHVLNNCEMVLQLQRFNERHDGPQSNCRATSAAMPRRVLQSSRFTWCYLRIAFQHR